MIYHYYYILILATGIVSGHLCMFILFRYFLRKNFDRRQSVIASTTLGEQ